jgi:hypothetical protein
MMFNGLIERASRYDAAHEEGSDLWATTRYETNEAGERVRYRNWRIFHGLSFTHWGIGGDLEFQRETPLWPGWVIVGLHLGPWSIAFQYERGKL